MKAFSLKLGIALAALLVTAGPALAQAGGDRDRGAPRSGDRGAGGGATTPPGAGASSTTGGGSVAGSSGGGGSVSSGGGGGGFPSPSVPSFSSPSSSQGDGGFRSSAPEHREKKPSKTTARQTATGGGDQKAAPPSASDGSPASDGSTATGWVAGVGLIGGRVRERAAERGTGTASRDDGGSLRTSESTVNVDVTKKAPNWSRPRGDRPATGVAVTRTGPRPPSDVYPPGDVSPPVYDSPYAPYYAFGFGTGCGLYSGYYGYSFYSPFGFGYGLPSLNCAPFSSDPNVHIPDQIHGPDQGSLKLKMKPRNAKVYVDGFYVGVVDEFDGAFQKLTLNDGRHKVEIRAEGYETTEIDVLIRPRKTVTFAAEMKKTR